MGAGKTVVGEVLARNLEYDFIDLDDLVVSDFQMAISEVFDRYGESRFREAEYEALVSTAARHRTVISTGGGAFCTEANRSVIHSDGGRSVFLDVPWTALAVRLGGDQSARPMFDTLERAERLFDERRKHYRRAMITVPLEGGERPGEVANRIQELVSAVVPCGT
jgi:shikimate kinase